MSNIKISELTEATEANENDLLMIIQNGENKKIKASKVGTGKAGGGDTLPIGAILPFSSDTIPNGWLLCDGRAVSRTEYAELFKAIGTKHGSGDGSTTFNLPNPKGRTLVGKDSSDTDFNELGKTGGEKTHTITTSEIPSHSHHISSVGIGSGSYGYNISSLSIGSEQKEYTDNTGGGQPHNNLQPYIVTNFIIKAKMTVAIEGEIIQEDGTASETNVYSSVAMDNRLKTNIVTGQEVATNEYIDGKRVYLKAFKITSLNDEMFVGNNIDYVKELRATVKDNSAGNWRTIPWVYNSDTFDKNFAGGIVINPNGNVKFQAGAGLSAIIKGYVEVYYTKN